MPWVKASLRGQTVYARADASGQLAPEGGKVEIRYKPNDGRRYDAMAKNLAVLPGPVLSDDTCGPADKPLPKAEGAAEKSKSPARPGRGGRERKPTTDAERSAALERLSEAAAKVPTNVYTDGACTGNPGPAGLGVVVVSGDLRDELSEYLGHATNNIAELTAIARGLELSASCPKPVALYTDSQYAIGVLTKGWKAKANVELVEDLRETLSGRPDVHIRYVPGHSGIPENERADELGREAIKRRATRRKNG